MVKHLTKIRNLSTVIKRAREQVAMPHGYVAQLWGFGSAFKNKQDCGDIDLCVILHPAHPDVLPFRYHDKYHSEEKTIMALRAGMKGISVHGISDVSLLVDDPILLFHFANERPYWRDVFRPLRYERCDPSYPSYWGVPLDWDGNKSLDEFMAEHDKRRLTPPPRYADLSLLYPY